VNESENKLCGTQRGCLITFSSLVMNCILSIHACNQFTTKQQLACSICFFSMVTAGV